MTEMTIANAVSVQHCHRARQLPNSNLNANFEFFFNAKCTFSIVNYMVTPLILLAIYTFPPSLLLPSAELHYKEVLVSLLGHLTDDVSLLPSSKP